MFTVVNRFQQKRNKLQLALKIGSGVEIGYDFENFMLTITWITYEVSTSDASFGMEISFILSSTGWLKINDPHMDCL